MLLFLQVVDVMVDLLRQPEEVFTHEPPGQLGVPILDGFDEWV
jgi:hypothetical protein